MHNIPHSELIAVLGRGIELAGSGAFRRWRPTRYIERFDENNWHPGVRILGITADSPDEKVVVGGMNANTLAAGEFVRRLWLHGKTPKVVAFIGGRPQYLSAEPEDLTGAKIAAEEFIRRSRRFHVSADIEVLACGEKNKNTKDDLVTALALAMERGFRTTAIITVAVHIPRSEEFMKVIRRERAEFRGIGVRFLSSEHILVGRDRRYRNILVRAILSRAYERTRMREEKEVLLIRKRSYVSLQDRQRNR
ncbi:MAG: hypothetical protein HY434_02875 [Candidatus Liptonbacteria bacterium]|nr:hypothetical protein [Candidatus Liptonbacteria bacterium]